MDFNPSTRLETRRLEILAEMEERKDALLREMSGVDKETLKKLREIVDDYYNARAKLETDIATINKTATESVANYNVTLKTLNATFERDLKAELNSVVMNDYMKTKVASAVDTYVEENSDTFIVVQETGDSETAVMSQKATTRELGKLSEEKVDKAKATEYGTVFNGAFVRYNNGLPEYESSPLFNLVEFAVNNKQTIVYSCSLQEESLLGIAFYRDDEYITGFPAYNNSSITINVPIGATFCRATFTDDNQVIVVENLGEMGNRLYDVEKKTVNIPMFKPCNYKLISLDFTNTDLFFNTDSMAIEPINNINLTDYIDIGEYQYIKFCGKSFAASPALILFDENHNYITSYPTSSDNGHISYDNYVIKLPENAKYCMCADNTAYIGEHFIRLEATNEYGLLKWFDRKWVVLGDSLTDQSQARSEKKYFDFVHDITGINIVNMGVSGTGYKNWTEQNFVNRSLNIPADCDVVTIFGSGNDMGKNYPLGEITDSGVETLCGCINTTIDNIYSVNPTVKLALVTPTPWNAYPTYTDNEMVSYSNAIVQICNRRGIPCLDLFRCSGMRPWDETFRELMYSTDTQVGVHPDTKGHQQLAPHFYELLCSLII